MQQHYKIIVFSLSAITQNQTIKMKDNESFKKRPFSLSVSVKGTADSLCSKNCKKLGKKLRDMIRSCFFYNKNAWIK